MMMTGFEKDLRALCAQASTAEMGARQKFKEEGRAAIVQADLRHSILCELLNLYIGHRVAGTN